MNTINKKLLIFLIKLKILLLYKFFAFNIKKFIKFDLKRVWFFRSLDLQKIL